MRAVARLRSRGAGKGARIAGYYLSAFTKRREVMASATQKCQRLIELAPTARSILFAQTQVAAGTAVPLRESVGVRGQVLDAPMDLTDRKHVFAGFEDGTHSLSPRPDPSLRH